MCGIAAIIGSNYNSDKLTLMLSSMQHRGPDADGVYLSENLCFGHKRLAILDLDSRSNQPFKSQDGNYVIIFNGEIYNYKKLRSELNLRYNFRTEGDTEVLLAAYIVWGKKCISKLQGMFSFVLYDIPNQKVFAARDRLGIKPFYYASVDGLLYISSELRALSKASGLSKINLLGLSQYLLYQHKFENETMLDGIKELPPGYYLEIDINTGFELSIKQFWSLIPETPLVEPKSQTASTIRDLMFNAVEERLVSDVPFGAFLSGGMDSSALVGIMSQISKKPAHTFHISFDEKGYNEKSYADYVADYWKTEHKNINISAQDFINEIPKAIKSYDYPGVDGINTYIVSKVTRAAGVTMALSGAGGDELFGGYPVFKYVKQWNALTVPRKAFYPLKSFSKLLPDSKQRQAMFLSNIDNDYRGFYSIFRQRLHKDLVSKVLSNHTAASNVGPALLDWKPKMGQLYSWVSSQELHTYVRSVLLRDTDQMSMANGLEVRVPFLDHNLVEYMLGVPDKYKQGTGSKPLMVEALGKEILPDFIVKRKKMGFVFPWALWLKKELFPFCKESIDLLKNFGCFNPEGLDQLLTDFQKGKVSYTVILSLVILAQWMHENQLSA